jgi:anti-sigma factor RsiW
MKADSHREWQEALGAYALGQLPHEERPGLEAHLEGCPACREELESLTSVAALLPLADPAQFDAAPRPSPDLLGEVVSAMQSERRATRRRRRWQALVPAFATVAAAAAGLALFVLPGGGEPRPGRHVEFASLPPGLEISANLIPHAFGTEIHMYVQGAPSGALCRVFVRSRNGARLSAGSFRYRWGNDSDAVLSSALDLSRTAAIGIRVGNRTFVAPVRSAETAMAPLSPTEEATT